MKSACYGSLTHERLLNALSYDPDTGLFTNNYSRSSNCLKGQVSGSSNFYGYIDIEIDYKSYRASRLAMFYVNGFIEDEKEVDHIDLNRANNSYSNLRYITRQGNLQNKKKAHTNSSSKLLGAHKKGDKWQAKIGHNGKHIYIGIFGTPEEAHEAYLKAKSTIHEFSTNFLLI